MAAFDIAPALEPRRHPSAHYPQQDQAQLWSVASGQPLVAPFGHRWIIPSVDFSPDGRFVLTGSWDDTARLWDVAEPGNPVAAVEKLLGSFQGTDLNFVREFLLEAVLDMNRSEPTAWQLAVDHWNWSARPVESTILESPKSMAAEAGELVTLCGGMRRVIARRTRTARPTGNVRNYLWMYGAG